jgi:hypothetical protein
MWLDVEVECSVAFGSLGRVLGGWPLVIASEQAIGDVC